MTEWKEGLMQQMSDVIARIGNSTVQHGKHNNRLYLMTLSNKDFPNIIDKLDMMASENGYSKIFAKIPSFARDRFTENGYRIEASIPRFRDGQEKIYFMCKYFDRSRMIDDKLEDINKILDVSRSKENILENNAIKFDLPRGFKYEICDESHVSQMANLYGKVFATYPFSIDDPEYIRKTMNENFIYFSIKKNDNIVALSSSEMDTNLQNVEMTDFATLPEYQGKGFALYLLYKMENEMRKRNMQVAYTISRSMSYGINILFAKMGYKYGGTLTNNTNISVIKDIHSLNNFESMNIWYTRLQ
jgi:putative beta-lysine N-acetyltransferase